MFYKTTFNFISNKMTAACDEEENLIGLWFEGQKYFADSINKANVQIINDCELKIFQKTKKWLDSYFKGEKPKITELPLAPIGNDFRKRVWALLCEIPYGKTTTYGNIAKIIAQEKGMGKMSAQAVGNAVGHNPISIIIPCHRVVGSNGNLTGYAGGIKTKIKLLELENADLSKLKIKQSN